MADNILIKLHTLILAVAWGSVVVMIYSCMVLVWRSRKQLNNPQLRQATVIRIGNQTVKLIAKLIIYLIAVVFAVLAVALYHCIRIGRCMQRQQHRLPQQQRRRAFHFPHDDQQSSLDNSIADLIPVHKFSKSTLDFESENDNICAICLSDFEEGEELRKLPQCVHSFHVTCIDMWFYSHTSCPICRTDATPSPQVLMHYLESDSVGPGVESREA